MEFASDPLGSDVGEISLCVTLGWCIGTPLTFLFDPFESIVLFLAGQSINRSELSCCNCSVLEY